MIMGIALIKKGEILYRYDLIKPPTELSDEYRSIEYDSQKFGKCKNMANLYFFFSNEEGTHNTAKVAMKKCNKDKYWITKVEILSNLLLLDLSKKGTAYLMLLELYENNIDVLNDNFKYNVAGNSFYLSDLYKTFERSLEISDEKVALIDEINAKLDCPQYLGRFSYLGQILTDFENGFRFKNILEQKQYDGYVFSESVGVDTVCLINKDALKIIDCQVYYA